MKTTSCKPSSLLEGALCSLHSCFHLVFSTVWNVQVYLPLGGVVAVDVTAAWHKLPVDKVLEHLHRRHAAQFLMLRLEFRSETALQKTNHVIRWRVGWGAAAQCMKMENTSRVIDISGGDFYLPLMLCFYILFTQFFVLYRARYQQIEPARGSWWKCSCPHCRQQQPIHFERHCQICFPHSGTLCACIIHLPRSCPTTSRTGRWWAY